MTDPQLTDHYLGENTLTRQIFDLEEILEFQLKHNVQVAIGADYQYHCHIGNEVWAVALTPLFAMAYGIKKFKEHNAL